MRHHGSRRGLAVGAGNAHGVAVILHDNAPCLGPLKNGNTGGTGRCDLRVIIMSRRRADDAVRPGDILLPVADGHLNATGDEFIRGNGSVHIRAGNKQAHALEHQSQGPHGHAADAHKVDVLARLKILLQFLGSILHNCNKPPDLSIPVNLFIIHSFFHNYKVYFVQIWGFSRFFRGHFPVPARLTLTQFSFSFIKTIRSKMASR